MSARLFRATVLAALLVPALGAPGAAQEADAPPPETRAAPAERPALSTFWDGALVDGENGTDFDETDGYRKLLVTLRQMTPEQVASLAPVTLDRERAVTEPDALRGDWVRVRGQISHLWAERLASPLDGSEDTWRGIVADTDGSEGIIFDLLEKPGELELLRDIVDVEGVFYRTLRYENSKGTMVEVPWILARSVTRLDPSKLPRTTGLNGWALLLIVLALAFMAIRFTTNLRRWKRASRRPVANDAGAIRRAAFSATPRIPPRKPASPKDSPPGSP